jgi:hypothetical protein
VQKSVLLRELQKEIRRHDLSTFIDAPPSVAQGGKGVTVPGCSSEAFSQPYKTWRRAEEFFSASRLSPKYVRTVGYPTDINPPSQYECIWGFSWRRWPKNSRM